MAFMDRLKFWKREETPELELGKYPALEDEPRSGMPRFDQGMAPPSEGLTQMPGESPDPSSLPPLEEIGPAPPPPGRAEFGGRTASIGRPSFSSPSAAMTPPQDMNRDMQIVQAKLDTLKALLDSVTAKLERIDRKLPEREEETAPMVARRWR